MESALYSGCWLVAISSLVISAGFPGFQKPGNNQKAKPNGSQEPEMQNS